MALRSSLPSMEWTLIDWVGWRFRFEVGDDMLDLGDHMHLALAEERSIPIGGLNKDSAQRAKLLYGIRTGAGLQLPSPRGDPDRLGIQWA